MGHLGVAKGQTDANYRLLRKQNKRRNILKLCFVISPVNATYCPAECLGCVSLVTPNRISQLLLPPLSYPTKA